MVYVASQAAHSMQTMEYSIAHGSHAHVPGLHNYYVSPTETFWNGVTQCFSAFFYHRQEGTLLSIMSAKNKNISTGPTENIFLLKIS